MSQNFKALQRSQGASDELISALFDSDISERIAVEEPEPVVVSVSDSALLDELAPAAEPMEAAPEHPAAPAPTERAPRHSVHLELDRTRTVPLQIMTGSPLLPFGQAETASEQYRIVRTKLTHHPAGPRTILISSGGSGDGKSVSAINLVGAMALKCDSNVLLVDGDLRRGKIHHYLGLPAEPGLTDVLEGRATLNEAIVRTEQFPSMYVLPAGRRHPNPSELLDSDAWRQTSAHLRETFRFVFIDSPPVGVIADYDMLASAADGILLVVRPDHTRRDACYTALDAVDQSKFLGVVLNCAKDWVLYRKTRSYSYYAGAY
jgi:capsular exopolysaccharide synthesis family protein